eukprot:PhF_6_TR19107/c0_g1_i1/m.28113
MPSSTDVIIIAVVIVVAALLGLIFYCIFCFKEPGDGESSPSFYSSSTWGGFGRKSATDDLEDYRNGYPLVPDNPAINDNLEFYSGVRRSRPNQMLITDFHGIKGKHAFLEIEHGYIQWLFPIQEHGMNHNSVPLQKHEITAMRNDPIIIDRIFLSYELILDFFGMELVDRATGVVRRCSAGHSHQYHNLQTSGHNYLRITRILKCLGEMGLEHLKKPWLLFFIDEIYANGELSNLKMSLERYWVGTLKDDGERMEVITYLADMKTGNRKNEM